MAEFQRKAVEVEEKIYVAVSKEVNENRSILTWALQKSGGKTVCLIHVHQPAKNIDIPEKKLSLSENEEGQICLLSQIEYFGISQQFGVRLDYLYIEADSIEKGIIQLIEQHNIEKLVMGAAADKHYSVSMNMMKVMSQKAIYVKDNAPPFCHIWFICSGCLMHTRKAIEPSEACDPRLSRWGTDIIDSSYSGLGSPPVGPVSQSSSESVSILESVLESVRIIDQPCNRLERELIEAENARQVGFEETIRRQKIEKDALSNAILKAKMAEKLYSEEVALRKAKEEELVKEYEAIEAMENIELKASLELRKLIADKFSLEKLMEESTRCHEETEEKLLSVVELLEMYKYEHEELELERDNALQEAENLRVRLAHVGPSISSSPVDVPVPVVLSVFSYSDLLMATMCFDASMKIAEGSHGSVYKGFLCDTEVTIKILNRTSLTHSPQQFDREVYVLSNLRHPNLASLVGTCPEICALVYEYLPGGSLEDRLMCKNNAPPLPWQTRVQIAIDLCSVLIFLHSRQPSCIVHGNLKPSNILLDANCVSKLCDFGPRELDDTDPQGAVVHMDPEFVHTGVMTPNSDVYSFGIILLRLLTGRSAFGIMMGRSGLSEGSIISKLDPSRTCAREWPSAQADQLARMAFRCCDMDQRNRPDLRTDVWSLLEPMKASHQGEPPSLLPSNSEAPNYFICPIFQEVMVDPHIACDGFTYEAEAIRGWLDGGHDNSPMTNVTLANHNLTPNRALRSAIQEWLLHNPRE